MHPFMDRHGFILSGGPVDEDGRPVERTKRTHPYSFDGYVVLDNRNKVKANATYHSDYIVRDDLDKWREAISKSAMKDKRFENASVEEVEDFLRKVLENDSVKLSLMMEYCNVATGYPLWRFDINIKS